MYKIFPHCHQVFKTSSFVVFLYFYMYYLVPNKITNSGSFQTLQVIKIQLLTVSKVKVNLS